MQAKKLYFSHAIRGITGSSEEIEKNCRLATANAAFMRAYLGPKFVVYCPAENDAFPQMAMKKSLLSIENVLAIDCALIEQSDFVLADTSILSKGVRKEIDRALGLGILVFRFAGLSELKTGCDFIYNCGNIKGIWA